MQWAARHDRGWSRRNIDTLLYQGEERRRLDISSASPLLPGQVSFTFTPAWWVLSCFAFFDHGCHRAAVIFFSTLCSRSPGVFLSERPPTCLATTYPIIFTAPLFSTPRSALHSLQAQFICLLLRPNLSRRITGPHDPTRCLPLLRPSSTPYSVLEFSPVTTTQIKKMASPDSFLDVEQRNRLPTLFEVLSRRTLAPVDLFSFYIYMRDQQRSVDYLDFW